MISMVRILSVIWGNVVCTRGANRLGWLNKCKHCAFPLMSKNGWLNFLIYIVLNESSHYYIYQKPSRIILKKFDLPETITYKSIIFQLQLTHMSFKDTCVLTGDVETKNVKMV